MTKYKVEEKIYEEEHVKLSHSCQVCDVTFSGGKSYLYLQVILENNRHIQDWSRNRWVCSENCANFVLLSNGDTNYAGYKYG